MADWKFVRKARNQKSRDPMQGEFFANSSIDDETHALVREAIQNSLDAHVPKSNEPVKVRFSLSGDKPVSPDIMNNYVSENAWKHFHAKNNGLIDPPNKKSACNFLVYEDFGTTGLIGDVMQHDYIEGEKNPFYFFMRAEGQSGKSEDDRGRWGVGKFVFPHASSIRSFYMYTVRNDDGNQMMAGQSILKSHEVDGDPYTPDGWFGCFEGNDDFQLPDNDKNVIENLCQHFNLSRTNKDSGLSIVIPYVNEEFTLEGIADKVISEYFFPILQEQLEVLVESPKASLFIDNKYLVGKNDESLHKLTPETSAMIKLAKHALETNEGERIVLEYSDDKPRSPNWEGRIDVKVAETIRKKLDQELPVSIRVPLYSRKKKREAVRTHFDMFVCRDELHGDGKPLFIREGIKIPEVNSRSSRGYRCLVVIDDRPLATMLGDAENPAHTEWEKNSSKYKNTYDWGPTTIDFMRGCLARLIHLLSQSEEEEDRTVLADIFSIDQPESDEDVPDSRKSRRKKPKIGPDDPDDVVIPPSKPRKYSLNRIEGGFTVNNPKDGLKKPHNYKIRVAYDRMKGSPWKKYSTNDFAFDEDNSSLSLDSEGIEQIQYMENELYFDVVGPEFMLKVTGFDTNRDIIVDVTPQEISNETI